MDYPEGLLPALEAFDAEWTDGSRVKAKEDAKWIVGRWPELFERWAGRDQKFMIGIITAARGNAPWSDGVIKADRTRRLLAEVHMLATMRPPPVDGHVAIGVQQVFDATLGALGRRR